MLFRKKSNTQCSFEIAFSKTWEAMVWKPRGTSQLFGREEGVCRRSLRWVEIQSALILVER